MAAHDAVWALQQYEAVRSLLPAARMPKESVHAENLEKIADLFDAFFLDAFGVLNVGDTAIAGAAQRVQMLKDMGKDILVLTNGACFPAEKALKKFLAFGVPLELTDESVRLVGCLTYAKVISNVAFGVGATTQKLASQLA